jgi:hypothetical protein
MATAPPTTHEDKLPQSTAPLADPSLTASCHCGRVTLMLPTRPTRLNECLCSVCYTYGALWTYSTRGSVLISVTASEKTTGLMQYVREDPGSDGDLAFMRCGHCGCLTHWWARDSEAADVRMGINARLLPRSALNGVERRKTQN